MEKARVQIISDGTAWGTKILIDGNPVEETVVGLTWTIRENDLGRAMIEFDNVAVDVVGEQVTP